MPWWLTLLNSVAGAGSAGIAAAAAARPELIAPPGTDPSARFYPTMYAARAVPFGLLVTAVCWLASAYPLTPFILAVAALAQFGDAVIGGLRRLPGMAAGARRRLPRRRRYRPLLIGRAGSATIRRLNGPGRFH